jgi:hypothetical protein
VNQALEKAIDEVGRDRVFARAEAHGWPRGGGAPQWIWWGIVQDLRENRPPPGLNRAKPFEYFSLGDIL